MSLSKLCHIGIRSCKRNCPYLAGLIVGWPITVVLVSCYRHGLVICWRFSLRVVQSAATADFTLSARMFVALTLSFPEFLGECCRVKSYCC